MLRKTPALRAFAVAGGILIVVAVLPRCASSDPHLAAAERAFDRALAGDPRVASYALEVASRSPSPFTRRLLSGQVAAADAGTALAAVRALAEEAESDPAAAAALREPFAGPVGPVRAWAAIGLARSGDDEARAWLLEHGVELGGAIRLEVLAALGRLGEREAILPRLRAMLDSEDRGERDAVYGVLGRIASPWAVELLIEGLEAEHGAGRRAAIEALGACGDSEVAPRLFRFVNTRGLVFATMEALGALGHPGAADVLRPHLADGPPLARAYAAAALWRLGALDDPRATLAPLAEVPDARVRATLAGLLGPVRDPAATELLGKLSADEDPAVRIAATRALAGAGAAAEPWLWERVGDDDYTVTTVALEALGRNGGAPDTAERLLPLVDDPNPYVSVSAAAAILRTAAPAGD